MINTYFPSKHNTIHQPISSVENKESQPKTEEASMTIKIV